MKATGVSRARWAALGAAVAVSLGGGGVMVTHATSSSGERDVFVPTTPCRLFDTRPTSLVGPRNVPIGPGQTMVQSVRGTNGKCVIPGDASAVALNVTSVNGSAASFLTIWPSDAPRPQASSLNWTAASPPTPNKVDVKLSADGKISLFNNAGSIDVLADVVGFYVDHNHDDRYYTKAQIDSKLPATGIVTIAGPAFQPTDSRAISVTDAAGCTTFNPGVAGATAGTLDAPVQLPVGVRITSVTVLIGNVFLFGSHNGGNATFNRRTITGLTTLASLDSYGQPDGLNSRTASLAVPDLVASGNYYFIRFFPNAQLLVTGTSVCGAEGRVHHLRLNSPSPSRSRTSSRPSLSEGLRCGAGFACGTEVQAMQERVVDARPTAVVIDPERTAVVVVDMQNDFASDGGMFQRPGIDVTGIRAIVPRITAVADAARSAGVLVCYLRMGFAADLSDAGRPTSPTWIKHLPLNVGDYSGFHGTDLAATLRTRQIDTLLFTGATTSVCVESTVREAMMHDFHCVVIEDCVAEPIGATLARTNHESTLLTLELLFASIAQSSSVIDALAAVSSTVESAGA